MVASASEIVRNGLAAIVRDHFPASIAYETDSWSGMRTRLARDEAITICLINFDLCGDAQRALRSIRADHPDVKIVVVGQSRNRVTILAAINAGAHGYIHEIMPMSEIAEAMRTVMTGRIYVPDLVAELTPQAGHGDDGVLTSRQQQVLELLTRGASNKDIARELNLAEGTVKAHLGGLFRALGVHTRTAAITSVHARLLA